MTTVSPFPGSIVRPEWALRVVTPMHDSLTAEHRTRILASNKYSYLHVTRPPEKGDDPEAVVEGNASAFRALLDAGAFEHFEEPAMYLYRLRTEDHEQTGIVAEVCADAFRDGRILGHEGVQRERVEALVRHLSRVPARSDLVAIMYADDADVRAVVETFCASAPLLDIRTDDGLCQTVWRLDDAQAIATLAARLAAQTLYIADGHHRVAASLRAAEDSGTGAPARLLSVMFPDHQLRALAFHRRVIGPVTPARVLRNLSDRLEVRMLAGPRRDSGTFAMYLAGAWYRLRPRGGGHQPGVESLDVTRLHRDVLEPVFGLLEADDPRLDMTPEVVPIDELTSRCDQDSGALFITRPPTLAQLVEVARRGEVMPPKATYFDPKPRSGIFLRFNTAAVEC